MKPGIIVLLNGTSSSGKTSISNELLTQMAIPFQHLSIDNFCNGIFHSYTDYINSTYPSIETNGAEDGQFVNQILLNPLISLYYSTIKLFSAMGNNVVVDSVIGNDKWFNACIELFSDHPVIFVEVKCSKEELARREKLRGDRMVGLANSQYDNVYCFNEYDLEFNTEIMRSNECANEILNFIRSNKEYTAFKKLIKGKSVSK
ncbi:chloramphenicol phosphotransferase CPT family protein [Paenibacillus sp. KQZ6P-2]|uniref:Chloramphenicol phosphotransferase CPT family protein n=1 Tax=Paenibacillus mangrovi TaxID=2931978 RepID=A0A9X1WWD0_9BACL|nr:AAA family ATPase [Paenibacillus mangrovi]MCJ8013204.1 chloramphenicol phosphotransferase CPT family protein [Paenibacillus mangrovi]